MLLKKPIVYYILLLFVCLFVFFNLQFTSAQQSSEQTYAWLHGRFDLVGYYIVNDTVVYNSKVYWTLGPLPSLLLLPIVFVSQRVNFQYSQNILNLLTVPLVFTFSYLLAKKRGFTKENALYLALAFCTGSVFLQAALNPASWMLSHTLTAFLTLLALVEYITKKRFWLIGILMSFVLATRPTAFIGIIFFVLDIFSGKDVFKNKLVNILKLFFPAMVVLFLLLYYNQVRFGNPLDMGYQKLANEKYFPLLETHYGKVLDHRLFSVSHFFRNLYVYFFIPVNVGLWGVNISAFIVCFPFLFALKADKSNKNVRISFIAVLVTLTCLLCYYWAGWDQLGPRYLIDLLPFAFLILLDAFKNMKLTNAFKLAVILTSLFNLGTFIAFYIRMLG